MKLTIEANTPEEFLFILNSLKSINPELLAQSVPAPKQNRSALSTPSVEVANEYDGVSNESEEDGTKGSNSQKPLKGLASAVLTEDGEYTLDTLTSKPPKEKLEGEILTDSFSDEAINKANEEINYFKEADKDLKEGGSKAQKEEKRVVKKDRKKAALEKLAKKVEDNEKPTEEELQAVRAKAIRFSKPNGWGRIKDTLADMGVDGFSNLSRKQLKEFEDRLIAMESIF